MALITAEEQAFFPSHCKFGQSLRVKHRVSKSRTYLLPQHLEKKEKNEINYFAFYNC